MSATYGCDMGLAQRKNAIYLHPKNSQLQFDTTKTYIFLDNLFNGEPTLSKFKKIYPSKGQEGKIILIFLI